MAKEEMNKGLQYDSEKSVNAKGSAILGKLYGPIADIVNSTRNGRKYPEELWENVFEDPLVIEQFECGGLFGEMNHPTDREETDLTQVCVCMPEKPKKKDGKLWASFDILDTPNGRILKTLCDYGYKIGVSSRGSGETYEDAYGNSIVDAKSYQLFGWDIVLIPAVKSARMKYVTESLHTPAKLDVSEGLRKALTESIESASEDDRKVMLETLRTLHFDYDVASNADRNNKVMTENLTNGATADNDGETQMLADLKRYMRENRDLSKQLTDLQEKLSVCNTKGAEYEESVGTLQNKVDELTETLKKSLRTVTQLNEQIQEKDEQIAQLTTAQEKSKMATTSLNESISAKDGKVKELEETIVSLNKNLHTMKESYEEKTRALNESVQELSKDSSIKKTEYESKMEKANKLTEKYRSIAYTAVEKYIGSQALMLGVAPAEIKGKLPNNYSFKDIDLVCESLKNFKLNTSSLPFDLNAGTVKMRMTESTPIKTNANGQTVGADDSVDDSLISLARLK